MSEEPTFSEGNPVRKVGGDYSFKGWVVGVVRKRSGAVRYVVENRDGLLHIFSGGQLEPIGSGSLTDAIQALREAGGKGWDDVDDPEAFLREFRGE